MGSDTAVKSKHSEPSKASPDSQVRQDITQLAQSVNQLVQAQKDHLKQQGSQQLDRLEGQVRERPLKYLGIAFAGGFLVSTLLSRKK
jgi:ElaB/YqjD/DUF883 family membrane-anchored ribosome-binding protein